MWPADGYTMNPLACQSSSGRREQHDPRRRLRAATDRDHADVARSQVEAPREGARRGLRDLERTVDREATADPIREVHEDGVAESLRLARAPVKLEPANVQRIALLEMIALAGTRAVNRAAGVVRRSIEPADRDESIAGDSTG